MADLRQRLQLVVDATTGKADTEFRKLTGTTRELGTTADKSASQVRAAADRVAEARERERVAAGRLTIAEQRLTELRASGRARQSQLTAAEEKAAAAQRELQRAVNGTSRALAEQQDATKGAATSLEDVSRSGGLLAGVTDKAKAGLASLVGVGIGAGLRGIADDFAQGAAAAGQFATSTNSSVEEAGAFLGLVGSLGLELNDLLEIQAEYAQKAAASAGDLAKLGAEVQRNEDGTINWTRSLVVFLEQLQKVPDATERNRLGFQFLGEEGYKQLSRLVASGVDVADALEQIGTPFTAEDIDAANEYNAQLIGLSLSGQRASQALGRALVPIATDVLEVFSDVIGVLEDVSPVIVAATGAALAMGITGFSPAALAGGRLAQVTAVATRNLAIFRWTAANAGIGAATLGATMGATSATIGAARAGIGRLAALAGGPLGIALIAGSVAFSEAADGADRLKSRAHDAALALSEISDQDDLNIATRKTANDLEETAGYWERSAAYVRGYEEDLGAVGQSMTWLTGPFQRLTMGFGDTADTARGFELAIEEAREELGEFGAQQEIAQQSTRALSDLIAQGVTSGDEFGRSVRDAAEAQLAQEQTSGLAAAAIEAYRRATDGAIEATLKLYNAQLSQSDALIGLQKNVADAAGVVDDLETPWNEVTEAQNEVVRGALGVAGSYADMAVAAAEAGDGIVTDLDEARIRGEATIKGLYGALQEGDITGPARKQVQDLINDLEIAQENGDVEAILRLTGADTTKGELDEATKDRDTQVRVESRNGPAVISYLDGIADKRRLALIRTESRNGPAVATYLDGLTRSRLALIRVETRNGPAVDRYLNELAGRTRTAYIDVRERTSGNGGGGSDPTGSAMLRGAPTATAGSYGSGGVNINTLQMIVQADATGRVTAQSLAEGGRRAVQQIQAYERRNGTGWRQGGRR